MTLHGPQQIDPISPPEQQLIALLSDRALDAAKLDGLSSLVDTLRRTLPEAVRFDLADRLRRTPPCGDVIRLHSVLFQLDGDLYHLERILHYLLFAADSVEPDLLHYTYWCIQRQLFLGVAGPEKAGSFAVCDLFRFYQTMVDLIARRWNLPPAQPCRPSAVTDRGPQRIAIVTNQFTGDLHQPSRDCFDFARRLQQDHGLEVMIFNTNLLPLMVVNAFIPPFIAEAVEGYRGIRTMSMFGQRAKVTSYPDRPFSRDKLAAVVDGVQAFRPDCVIAFGGSNIVADLFAVSRTLPVVCIPTTAGLTPALADIILGFDPHDWTATLPAPYRAPFAGRFRPFTFGYSLPPLTPDSDAYTLAAETFTFAVVGTRLDDEVSAEFIAMAEELLDQCDRAGVCAEIAFTGPVSALPARLAASRHAARLRCLGHLRDIRSFYRRIGALLNPPRQGGGGSAAYALAEGVPVVSLNRGDVASVTGPQSLVSDRAEFINRAVRLATDPAFRAAAADAARTRFAQVGDRSESTRRLLDYCREAMRLHAGR